jgi:hypothetical protein
MDHGFTAYEQKVADVVLDADVDDVFCLLKGDAFSLAGIEL